MDPKRPSHLASAAIAAAIVSVVALVFYTLQSAQQISKLDLNVSFISDYFDPASLMLLTISLGAAALVLGFIVHTSTSRYFPDYLPSHWAMTYGLITAAIPIILNSFSKYLLDYANANHLDGTLVFWLLLGAVGALLLIALLILSLISHFVKKELKQKEQKAKAIFKPKAAAKKDNSSLPDLNF